MQAEGAAGFKAFTVAAEPELPPLHGAPLSETMARIAALGSTLVVHAEDDEIVAAATRRLRQAGRADVWAHQQAHPPEAEIAAIADVTARAAQTGCRVQVAHVSTGTGLDLVAAAAARGLPVTAEVAPHHLLLSEDDVGRQGPWVKTTPPLRPGPAVDELWAAVAAGQASFFGSDHAPWTRAEKQIGAADIWQAGNGIPALQHMAPLLLTEWERRGLPLARFAALSSANFARWLGLPGKGQLAPGADADLAVFQRGVDAVISPAGLLSVQHWTPYEGRRVTWAVAATMLHGQWACQRGAALAAPPGAGLFIRPPAAGHPAVVQSAVTCPGAASAAPGPSARTGAPSCQPGGLST
jgi:allantoinase